MSGDLTACEEFIPGGSIVWIPRSRAEAHRRCHRCWLPVEEHTTARVEQWHPAGPFIYPTTVRIERHE